MHSCLSNRNLAGSAALLALLLIPPLASARSLFDGTWRPDPQLAGPTHKPESVQLIAGQYDCRACDPPYKIQADGRDHSVPPNSLYDSLNVSVLDPHTVKQSAKRNGTPTAEILISVSPDGSIKSEKTTVSGVAPNPIEITRRYRRLTAGAPGSHAVSGAWQLIDTDVTNHAEDTTFKIDRGALTMTDRLGGSYVAKLDGSKAPYRGNPLYTTVSVKQIDARTLVESDLNNGKVVQIRTWSMAADGNTLHARVDDTQGQAQEQNAHRVP